MGNLEPLFTWKIRNHCLHGKSGTTIYMGNLEPLFTWEIWNHYLYGKSGTTIYMGNLEPLFTWEIWNPCLYPNKNWHDCAWSQEVTFPSLWIAKKNVTSFGGVTKVSFSLRNSKNHYFARAIFWAGSVRSSTIRQWDAWHVRWCYWGFNIFDWLPSAKEDESRSQRRLKNAIFVLFWPFWTPVNSNYHQNWNRFRTLCYLYKFTSKLL